MNRLDMLLCCYRGHVPYRNSLMTQVLRDSLGGNCCTAMIATVNAQQEQLEESISTCRFAQRVAMVQNEVSLVAAPSVGHCHAGCLYGVPLDNSKNSISVCNSMLVKGPRLLVQCCRDQH